MADAGVAGPEPSGALAPDRAYFLDINRTRLRIWEWGPADGPPVVLAHGAHDHGRMWDGFAPLLAARGFRVVAPDLRGHGDSGRNGSLQFWMASALDLALLARRLGPPIGWIGHSYGSRKSLYVAGMWPELARWVVSIDGLGPPGSAFAEKDMREAARSALDGAVRALTGPPRPYPSREVMVERRMQVNTRLPREWVEHLVRHGSVETEGGYAWKADPIYAVALPGSFSLERLYAESRLVRCPVLVLTGGEPDTWRDLTPGEKEERLAHLGTARHVVVPGAGHYLHIEQPEATVAAMDAFLAGRDGGPGSAGG